MMKKKNHSILPNKFPHIFVDIAWDLIPEAKYDDLVYLSELVKQSGKVNIYKSLVDCLRKIQWAKIAGQEAITGERVISEQATPDNIVYYPVGQVKHQKALFDFIANGKAALDSLAVFLNLLLNIRKKGGDRDFRKASFCEAVCKSDEVIGNI